MLQATDINATFSASDPSEVASTSGMASFPAAAVVPVKKLDFQTLLNDLPRELYDQIRELTFEAIDEAMGSCTEDYDFSCEDGRTRYAANLKILHLNQALRERYAEKFYRRRTFSFELAEIPRLRHQTLAWVKQWLRSVPAGQRQAIGKLVLVYPWCHGDGVGRLATRRGAIYEAARSDMMDDFGLYLATKIFCKCSKGKSWNWEKGIW